MTAGPRPADDLYRVRIACRLCSSRQLTTVLRLTDCPAGDSLVPVPPADAQGEAVPDPVFPLTVQACAECRNVQLREVVDPGYLYGKYTYNTAVSTGLAEHFDSYAAAVLASYRPTAGALVVDVGSNDGTLLRAFAKRGMTALGVEPAAGVARTANDSGVTTINAFFDRPIVERIQREHGPAAVVTANNVVANIDDLEAFCDAITALLATDGVFVLETGYVADQINDALFDNVYHEHLSYFSVAPLERFFALRGLQMIEALRVRTKGGSIRCVFQRSGGPRAVSGSVAQITAEERAAGVGLPESFVPLSERISTARARLHSALGSELPGARIAGYGASVGAVTMLYHMGLGDRLERIIDDDTLKQGKLTPGHRIPVVSPATLDTDPPDVLVILAWRYADAIMENRRRFAERGGRFLVPWPELRVA